MPVTDKMLLPARCYLALKGSDEPTSLQPGDTIQFGLTKDNRVRGNPKLFRGERELTPTTIFANGCIGSGISRLLIVREPKDWDSVGDSCPQAMSYAQFIASVLGFTVELVEKSAERVIYRFSAPTP